MKTQNKKNFISLLFLNHSFLSSVPSFSFFSFSSPLLSLHTGFSFLHSFSSSLSNPNQIKTKTITSQTDPNFFNGSCNLIHGSKIRFLPTKSTFLRTVGVNELTGKNGFVLCCFFGFVLC